MRGRRVPDFKPNTGEPMRHCIHCASFARLSPPHRAYMWKDLGVLKSPSSMMCCHSLEGLVHPLVCRFREFYCNFFFVTNGCGLRRPQSWRLPSVGSSWRFSSIVLTMYFADITPSLYPMPYSVVAIIHWWSKPYAHSSICLIISLSSIAYDNWSAIL